MPTKGELVCALNSPKPIRPFVKASLLLDNVCKMSTPPLSSLPDTYLYEYRGANLLCVAIVFIPIEILFVSLRYYSRYLIKTPTGIDDILALPSLIACLNVNVLAISKCHVSLKN